MEECTRCGDTGKILVECMACEGTGSRTLICPDCKDARLEETCQTCQGSGRISEEFCSFCYGQGQIPIDCPDCKNYK